MPKNIDRLALSTTRLAKIASGISGSGARAQMKTKAAPSTSAARAERSTVGERQGRIPPPSVSISIERDGRADDQPPPSQSSRCGRRMLRQVAQAPVADDKGQRADRQVEPENERPRMCCARKPPSAGPAMLEVAQTVEM